MTAQSFTVTGVRVSHERASVDQLEVATPADPVARAGALLDQPAVSEAFVLATCNRVEAYVVTETAAQGRAALDGFAGEVPPEVVVEMDHADGLRHLLRVAAGLESQVLGEDAILGQLKGAFRDAAAAGSIGPVLEAGLLKAIHVGERARTETGINDGTVSLGGAAVTLAARECGLAGRVALVVGAGETAGTVIRALSRTDIEEVRLVNRSPEGAATLAGELSVPVEAGGLDSLPHHLRDADVVFSATGSREHVIGHDDLDAAGETLVIDLAQPRDVAPGGASAAVAVKDLDDLRPVTEETHAGRREAATAVEAIIDEEFDLLIDQYKRRRADAVIAAMYRSAERMKQRELREALGKLETEGNLDAEGRRVVEALAESLVSRLLAVPTRSLREAAANDDWETIATAIELFDPNVDEADRRELLQAAVGAATAADAGED